MLGEIPFTIAGEIAKAERARGEAVLAEVQAALKRADVAVRLLEGGPAEEIVRVANEEDFGMVVVGSRGHNAVSRVLLGSVADRVLHTCKRPVLVVR